MKFNWTRLKVFFLALLLPFSGCVKNLNVVKLEEPVLQFSEHDEVIANSYGTLLPPPK